MLSRISLLLLAGACATQAADLVVLGDSWGTYGREALLAMLARQGSNMTVNNIAVSGTTSNQWAHQYKSAVAEAVSAPDVKHVWVTLGGNDASYTLPFCALQGKGADECIDQVLGSLEPNLDAILQNVKAAAPQARVFAFGYDILGLGQDNGFLCSALPVGLFPSCKGDTTCFNQHFLRLQTGIEEVAARHSDQMDALNLLGSIQAGAGVAGASLQHPVLSQYSPGKYMLSNCIHPNDDGFAFVFDNLWKVYLSKFQ